MSDPDAQRSGTKRPPRPRTPPPQLTGVVLVGMSVAIWWPAFTLGA